LPSLAEIRKGWNHAARQDALYNILTIPEFANGGWDVEDFFGRGEDEMDSVLGRLDDLGLRGKRRYWALDFGCGVGRITQALAGHYKHVDGVDISGEMIRRARAHNNHGKHVNYYANAKADLSLFRSSTFDLIYSVITLQHMPQGLQRGYIKDFIRVLHPDGVAVFQIPEGQDVAHHKPWLSMFGTPRATVERWVVDYGGSIVDVTDAHASGGDSPDWRYSVVRA